VTNAAAMAATDIIGMAGSAGLAAIIAVMGFYRLLDRDDTNAISAGANLLSDVHEGASFSYIYCNAARGSAEPVTM